MNCFMIAKVATKSFEEQQASILICLMTLIVGYFAIIIYNIFTKNPTITNIKNAFIGIIVDLRNENLRF